MINCRFELFKDSEGEYAVRLSVDGHEDVMAPFDLDLFTDGRLQEIVYDLETAAVKKADIKDIGTGLWNALRPEPIRKRLDALKAAFRVALKIPGDREINRLPWEAMYDETALRFLACDRRRALTRLVSDRAFAANEPITAGPVRLLVVVPRGSSLNTGREISNLLNLKSKLGIEVKVLDDRVTAANLRECLRGPWDIFHFIGHSGFSETAGVEVRLNGDADSALDEQWLDANQFAEILAGTRIRLAVFNSCESDRTVSPSISGLGQQVSIVAGVPAVVVMRYQIDDPSSLSFSTEFYRELFSPLHPGRVDIAMQEARNSLYTSARAEVVKSFITPVLHMAEGCEEIFPAARLSALAPAQAAVEVVQPPRQIELPDAEYLIGRFRNRLCVPFVGGGLRAPASRDQAGPATPTQLQLLNKFGGEYPDRNELLVAETVSELSSVLLPRVLQHYVTRPGRDREALIRELQTAYRSSQVPPALRRIANWPVPGVIYTEIDGMMEEAFRAAAKPIHRVNVPDAALASSADARDEAVVTLFNLRGTLTDFDSLVLTDTDHDALLHQKLVDANTDVTGLFKKTLGRSVLFLGVSPLDQAVRRLARLFLECPRRVQGKRYFVAEHISAGDRAYWEDLDVIWIEADPLLVVETIDAALGGG